MNKELSLDLPDVGYLLESDLRFGNYATIQFEMDEPANPNRNVDREALQRKYDDAIREPLRCTDFY